MLATAAAALLLWTTPAFAAVINVTTASDTLDASGGNCATMTLASLPGPDGVVSLREAICVANNNAGADTINVPAGTYNLTRIGNDDNNSTGDLDIRRDSSGGSLTITGAGAATTTVNAPTNNRVFDINHSVSNTMTVTISGLTITGGNPPATGSGNVDVGNGGGIRSNNATLTLTNDVITANRAGTGGGVDVTNTTTTTVTMTGTTISSNTATATNGVGGGINVSNATGNFTNDTITGNRAVSGGGINENNSGTTTITLNGTTVSNNIANGSTFGGNNAGGGGINMTSNGDMVINNLSTVSGNQSNNEGGGIRVESSSDLTIDNSSVINNFTTNNGDGGGISLSGGGGGGDRTLDVRNSSHVNNNDADDDGGGIYAEEDNSSIIIESNSTVSSNHSDGNGAGIRATTDEIDITIRTAASVSSNDSDGSGGGIYLDGDDADLNIQSNSSVNSNHADDNGGGIYVLGCSDVRLTSSTLSLNTADSGAGLFADDNGCGGGDNLGLVVDASTIGSNTANGGGGGGIHMEGNDTNLTVSGNSHIDLNVANNGGDGGGIDADDFETITLNGTTVSSNVARTGATNCSGGGSSFGGGIRIRNDGVMSITGATTISGNTACSGGGGVSQEDSARLTITATTSASVVISGNTTSAGGGGGIRQVSSDSLSISGNNNAHDVQITNNTATAGGGGGLLIAGSSGGSPVDNISFTTISGNTATAGGGGGILVTNGNSGNTNLAISNSTISGNTATGANGGGILQAVRNLTLNLTRSTISGNTANGAGLGGGLFRQNSTTGGSTTTGSLSLTSVTMVLNTANGSGAGQGAGGGMNVQGSNNFSSTNSLISDNTGAGGADCSFGQTANYTSGNWNLIGSVAGGTNCNTVFNAAADQKNVTSGIDTTLQNNGGTTLTHGLLPGSNAIDKGRDTNTTDQRGTGFTRPIDIAAIPNATGGNGADIGAYEVNLRSLTVNGAGNGSGTMNAPIPTGGAGIIACTWNGTAKSGTCAQTGNDTTTYVITATPSAGSSFTGWTGCDSTSGPADPATGANTVCNVRLVTNKTVTGNFRRSFLLTVNGSGDGIGAMVSPAPTGLANLVNCNYNGTTTTGPSCTPTGLDNSTFVITATPDASSAFNGWTGCTSTSGPTDPITGANTTCTITTNSAKTVTGNFMKKFLLTVTGTGTGSGTMIAPKPTGAPTGINCGWSGTATTGTICSQTAIDTTVFVITAAPAADTAFDGWDNCDTTDGATDPVTGKAMVCHVTVSSAKTVTGHFVKKFQLTVTGTGTGSGAMVAPAPTGVITSINCNYNGTTTSGTCTAIGLDTTEYVITATPAVDSAFDGWTGCDTTDGATDPVTGKDTVCHVTTSSAKTVTGTFTKKFLLTVDGAGDGTGSMASQSPVPGVLDTISCAWDGAATSGSCTATGLDTTEFIITATADTDSAFDGWTGCDTTDGATDPVTGKDTVCHVTTSSAKTVTGHFVKKFTLTVQGAGTGNGDMVSPVPTGVITSINCNYDGTNSTGTCSATGLDTTEYVITATPASDSAFDGWDNCDTTDGPTDPVTGKDTVCHVTTNAAKTVTGHFTKKFLLTVQGAGTGNGNMAAPVPAGVVGDINCDYDGTNSSGTCTATGLDTTEYVITATPAADSAFDGWTGCDTTDGATDPVTGKDTVCHVTTSNAKTVTGTFTKKFLLTVDGAGDGTGSMASQSPVPGVLDTISCAWDGAATSGSCTATGLDTTEFIITATADTDSAFDGWTGCDTTDGATDPVTGKDTVCHVTTSSAKTVTGHFVKKFTLTVQGAGTGNGDMVSPVPTGVITSINCNYDGTNSTGTCSATGLDTTEYVITATPASDSAFDGWDNCDTTDGPTDPVTGKDTVCHVTTNAAKTVTGHFTKKFLLTVQGAGTGSGLMASQNPVTGIADHIDCAYNKAGGTLCTAMGLDTTEFIITATPDAGSSFDGWTGCDTTDGATDPVTGKDTVCHVTTSSAKTVTGTFTKRFVLTVTGADDGSGNMASQSPVPGILDIINCGWNGAATTGPNCTANSLDTTTFDITATPSIGSAFTGWTGCDTTDGPTDPVTGAATVCHITTSGDKTVTGHFSKVFLLTVNGTGSGGGNMTAPAPAGLVSGITCAYNGTTTSGDCTQLGFATSNYTITAAPLAGSQFDGWTGCDTTDGPADPITGAATVCHITTNSAKTVTGAFRLTHVLTVAGGGNGTGTMTAPQPAGAPGGITCAWNGTTTSGAACSQTAVDTTVFHITAAANTNMTFTGWTGCNTTSGPNDPLSGAQRVCNVTVSSNKTVTANFEQTHTLTMAGTGDGTGTMVTVAPLPAGATGTINCGYNGTTTTGSPCSLRASDLVTYIVRATSTGSSAFNGWAGCDSVGGPADPITGARRDCTVSLGSDKIVTANFVKVFLLTVNGAGSGSATMNAPAPTGLTSGITCAWNGTATSGDCTQFGFATSSYTLTYTLNPGTAFDGWTGCDTVDGATDPITGKPSVCHITTDTSKTVTGTFRLTHTLTVAGGGTGTGSMTAPQPVGAPGGISCAWNGTATSGTACSQTAVDTTTFVITATPDASMSFTGWTGCNSTSGATDPISGAAEVCNVTTSAAKTVTANFEPIHTLKVTGADDGTGTMIAPQPAGALGGIDCGWNGTTTTGTACTRQAPATTTFVIVATPNGTSAFTGWDNCDSTSGPTDPITGANKTCTVKTDSDKTVTGHFKKIFSVTVTGTGNGGGTMIDTGLIDCGWNGTTTTGTICSKTNLDDSAALQITATPNANSEFGGWTGCDSRSGANNEICVVSTSANKTVTAKFTLKPILTVAATGTGAGSASDTTPGGTITCDINAGATSNDCTEQVSSGTAFLVAATPAAGSAFMGWTGCASTSGPNDPFSNAGTVCHITLNADKTITARFELVKTLTVNGTGAGTGTMTSVPAGTVACTRNGGATSGDCDQQAPITTAFVIKAAPAAGSSFTGWTGCDSTSGPVDPISGANTTCNVALNDNVTVTGDFATVQTLTVKGAGNGAGTMTAPGLISTCAWSGTATSGDCVKKVVTGTVVEITATSATTSEFVNWAGCDSTSGANNEVCKVAVNAATTVTASFKAMPKLTAKGGGAGQATLTGTGINCAVNQGKTSGDCTEQASTGTDFDITAAPSNAETIFLNWVGCDSTSGANNEICHVKLNADTTVTANFKSLCGILVNCSFESPSGSAKAPTSWTGIKVKPVDGTDTSTFQSGAQSYKFAGSGHTKTLRQEVAFSGLAKQKFTLTFWTKALKASKKGMYRVVVWLFNNKANAGKFFINAPYGTHDWTKYTLSFAAKKNFNKIRVDLTFGKTGTAWFDFLELELVP